MTVNNLIYKLTKYFSWLFFRQWERWELLIIVLISLVLLLLIIWQHRKSTKRSIYVNQVRERSPIIGVKLADNRNRVIIEDLKDDRSAVVSKKQAKRKKTKEQLDKLNEQIQQLQLEISKHKQTEGRLERQVTELKAANKKLQSKTAVNHKPQHESAESSTVKQEISELAASNQQSRRRAIAHRQSGRILREQPEKVRIPKELREQPLDVEKLKAMAELARKIRGRPRR